MAKEEYLGFKGIPVDEPKAYYLCDFSRCVDEQGTKRLKVEAQAGFAGQTTTSFLSFNPTERKWSIDEGEPIDQLFASHLLKFVKEKYSGSW